LVPPTLTFKAIVVIVDGKNVACTQQMIKKLLSDKKVGKRRQKIPQMASFYYGRTWKARKLGFKILACLLHHPRTLRTLFRCMFTPFTKKRRGIIILLSWV
jgi:hypothetical protein